MSMEEYGTERLLKELWDKMNDDGGVSIAELDTMKSPADRRGRVKRLLCTAIEKSSLGEFGGGIYYFGGKVYVFISRTALRKVLYEIMANKLKMKDRDLMRLSDIYFDCENFVMAKPLQSSNSVMVFRNGVLDVERMEFHRRFDRRFVQMWSVDYDYNPKANTFLWHQFINQVLPDKYLQDVLQMFLGATFIDRKKVKIEHIVILLGHGANGKSVIQQTVKGVLGEDYVSEQSIGRICKAGNDGDFAVSEINGKRLNYCTEMEVTDFYRKTARLKAVVSGEKTTARRLYGMPYYADHIPLLMANANQIPIFNKKDEAMLRRIYVIPFNVKIPEEKQNKSLADELVEEYPAILNWILEGRKKFIDNGYRLPPDLYLEQYVVNEKSEYNTALNYMSKKGYKAKIPNVGISPLKKITLSELYVGYQKWCWRNNIDAYGKGMFTQVLENEGGYVKTRNNRGTCFFVYISVAKMKDARLHRERKAKLAERADIPCIWKDGVKYVTTLKDLAECTGVKETQVYNLSRAGKFAEFILGYRSYTCYGVEGCAKVMMEAGLLNTDEENAIIKRVNDELAQYRRIFNDWSQRHGFPYRMYKSDLKQIEDDIIVVPDDTSRDEAIEMAKKAGYDVASAEKGKKFYK